MQLSSSDVFLLSQCAISAAYQAGYIVTQHAQQPVAVQSKIGGDSLASQVVTEVDHLCQDRILQTLMPTCARYDLALLTEENPDDRQRLDKDFFWCIDPLDGTLPFIQRTPGYAVSIALVSRTGVPEIGVIYDPVLPTLYSAVRGCGAFRNSQAWVLKPNLALSTQTFTLVADQSFQQHPLFTKTLADLKNIALNLGYKAFETLLQGGAAMNACWVLEKSPACYFKFPKIQAGGGSVWDYAASACLFHEMGAVASDMVGQPLDLNRVDGTFMNHRGVLYACDDGMAECIRRLHVDRPG